MTAAPFKEILALNRFDAGRMVGFPEDLSERLRRRSATFGASSVLFYEQPIEMVRAEGTYMYDASGRRYLDVYNNVPSVGHCHPRVVAAIAEQAARINIHTRYLTRIVETYSERLLATYPENLSNLVMTCTGSESNDLALRIARIGSGAEGFIVTETAYHGNTALVTEISPSALRKRRPAPFVRTVPAPSGSDPSTVAATFAANVEAAIADLKKSGYGVAALIIDSIFSSDGIYADPAGFLKPAVEAVRNAGGLFIADEVQPGFGRTGFGLWGFMRHDITPDIVTMGKPMGNGFPMGGVITRPDLLQRFCEETGYFNTFGGNPVAAAAGLAVLDVIADEGLMHNADGVGSYFAGSLGDLKSRHSAIGDIRGAGLFIGLDFVSNDNGKPDTALAIHVINEMKKRGILIGAAGKHGATLKIRPPLCFSKADADYFSQVLSEILGNR
ncbi:MULTISPECIES: aspartate aminotransferase family protein [Agrobacterium]|uniref:Aspartate aminotransferase family protein n=1 Tax=Agrobacterium tumefaciens TaxID=358 RepID=A0AAE6EHN3_AGRTU|nr:MULTISPECIES: aspartate aminotransferase family protein [Agrobacterium]QCL77176.1 aspartate aminotransferase family protein [Agrobacterium tumefaciens]QCL82684.1 aspartate aminotransferase family protein [Agrobacterium tumefaciens]CUX70378.1 pyridoxal phosphate aminotransferase [Agrobacterium sp. NCPPB 925]